MIVAACLNPVFHPDPLHAAELAHVVGDDDQALAAGMTADLHVMRTARRSRPFLNRSGREVHLSLSGKTTAQGRPDASAEPVCSCAHSYAHIARETAGAARTRLSLRPLLACEGESCASLGHRMPRECGAIPACCLGQAEFPWQRGQIMNRVTFVTPIVRGPAAILFRSTASDQL